MNSILKSIITLIFAALILTGAAFAGDAFAGDAFAGDDMKGHDMSSSDKMGDLFHESVVDGFMLSYYIMDLRDQKNAEKKDMDKPHHIMLYIMDKDHKPVLEGKVGFMIKKGDTAPPQKAMAMYMSKGFGITADMKQKGVYSITAKALLGDTKLVDSFAHEMK
ncbi:MAG: hypothetical protein QM498_04535 [Desulfobacterium sp.]